MKAWSPNWKDLPPVEPVDRSQPLAPVELTAEEREKRRRDYRENHEKHARGGKA